MLFFYRSIHKCTIKLCDFIFCSFAGGALTLDEVRKTVRVLEESKRQAHHIEGTTASVNRMTTGNKLLQIYILMQSMACHTPSMMRKIRKLNVVRGGIPHWTWTWGRHEKRYCQLMPLSILQKEKKFTTKTVNHRITLLKQSKTLVKFRFSPAMETCGVCSVYSSVKLIAVNCVSNPTWRTGQTSSIKLSRLLYTTNL